MNSDDSKVKWGRMIGDLRREARLSERKLAREVGINRATLRKIESGEGIMHMNTLEAVLRYFGYELDAIRVGEPRPVKERRKPGPKPKMDTAQMQDFVDWTPDAPKVTPAMKALLHAPNG